MREVWFEGRVAEPERALVEVREETLISLDDSEAAMISPEPVLA